MRRAELLGEERNAVLFQQVAVRRQRRVVDRQTGVVGGALRVLLPEGGHFVRLVAVALEIAAAVSAAQGNLDAAITTMQNAVALEESMPPPQGPPLVIKPAHELLGEILLQAQRPADAGQQFAIALYRHPNRARALLGTARAAAQSGDRAQAVRAYTQLLQQWQPGDVALPERQEAQEYL